MKASDSNTVLSGSSVSFYDEKTDKQDSPVVSSLNTIPLLNLTTTKTERDRIRARSRSGAPPPCERGDNQTAHLSRNSKNSEKRRSWVREVGSRSTDISESLLLHLAAKAVVPSPQKLSLPLLKLHNRRTWHGGLKLKEVAGVSHSVHRCDTLQRRHSNSEGTLATFQVAETILLAEIDSDEHCATFLREKATRESIAPYRDGVVDSTQRQYQYKLHALDWRIQANQEKLAQLRDRIAVLGGKPTCLTAISLAELNDSNLKKTTQNKKKSSPVSRGNKQVEVSGAKKLSPIASAALMIQCAYRKFRARRHLVGLLAKTYQRILNPGTDQYFYYNRNTRQSHWEAPLLLRHHHFLLDEKPKTIASSSRTSDLSLHAAAKVIQNMFRQRTLREFEKDLEDGNLEKVYDVGYGAWYYYNSRTNRSFWESVDHVQLTTTNSAIYHRQQPWPPH